MKKFQRFYLEGHCGYPYFWHPGVLFGPAPKGPRFDPQGFRDDPIGGACVRKAIRDLLPPNGVVALCSCGYLWELATLGGGLGGYGTILGGVGSASWFAQLQQL